MERLCEKLILKMGRRGVNFFFSQDWNKLQVLMNTALNLVIHKIRHFRGCVKNLYRVK